MLKMTDEYSDYDKAYADDEEDTLQREMRRQMGPNVMPEDAAADAGGSNDVEPRYDEPAPAPAEQPPPPIQYDTPAAGPAPAPAPPPPPNVPPPTYQAAVQQQQAATPATQATAASVYSTTPTAAPTGPTTNQGVQDVLRNTLLERATQPRNVGRDDPNVRAQADAFAANQERMLRSQISDAAERTGPYASGALAGQSRMLAERAGNQAGIFEADLIGREVGARREEIMAALSGLAGLLSQDQERALREELARLDAQLTWDQLSQQQRQFGDTLGFNLAQLESNNNDRALRLLLGL